MPGTDGRALERECQSAIIQAAQSLGYRAHAERQARVEGSWRTPVEGDAGFPDLVIIGYGHIFIYELKRLPVKYQRGQLEWLALAEQVTAMQVHSGVLIVPEQQPWFLEKLAEIAARERLG